jgi:hypothetical protein
MQSFSEYTQLSMTFSDHLTWKIIMKNIIHLITSFNQLHASQAIRSTYHTTLQTTPCQLVFGRDMIHKESVFLGYMENPSVIS